MKQNQSTLIKKTVILKLIEEKWNRSESKFDFKSPFVFFDCEVVPVGKALSMIQVVSSM
jgi:hypothetical protein